MLDTRELSIKFLKKNHLVNVEFSFISYFMGYFWMEAIFPYLDKLYCLFYLDDSSKQMLCYHVVALLKTYSRPYPLIL